MTRQEFMQDEGITDAELTSKTSYKLRPCDACYEPTPGNRTHVYTERGKYYICDQCVKEWYNED